MSRTTALAIRGRRGFSGVDEGATCQQHAYELLRLSPFGSHVAVYLGDGRAVHLYAEVGKPVVWTLDEFAQRPRYRVLVAIKRVARGAP